MTLMNEAFEKALELKRLEQQFKTINMKESTFSEADFMRMLELRGYSKKKIEKIVQSVHDTKRDI